MALGDVSNSVQSGGAPPGASASSLAKTVIGLGLAPLGAVNQLLLIGSLAAAKAAFDAGPLLEWCAKMLQHVNGGQVFAVLVAATAVGAISATVTQTGNGAGTVTPSLAPHRSITIKCVAGGALGTSTFQFSLDGGVTYGAVVASVAGATWVYAVPGTFCTLTFNAAAYVATKTCVIGVDGSITNGVGWVGAVTQASSPIDNYDVVVSVVKGGALGAATIQVSLDGGLSYLPNTLVPVAGVVVVPGTGLVLTMANVFNATDTYSFACAAPSCSSTDVTNAIAAVSALANAPTVALVHATMTPTSAAAAVSLASAVESALATAASTYGKQWIGAVECPSKVAGDTVVSAGFAVADTVDDDATVRAASLGPYNHTSVFFATQYQQSAIGSYKIRRPVGWGIVARYVEADPRSDVSEVGRGPLDFYLPGGVLKRDEWSAPVTLHDARYNVLRTYPGRTGAYLAIESGGTGWRNMTTDPAFQDANAVRVLALFLNAITVRGQIYLGSRQDTKPDGTIADGPRADISGDLDAVGRRSLGLLGGGSFTAPQASSASAAVLATSQLGQAPKRLDVQYSLQSLGQVTAVADKVFFAGVLPVS